MREWVEVKNTTISILRTFDLLDQVGSVILKLMEPIEAKAIRHTAKQ
jgi:hypothetical protein